MTTADGTFEATGVTTGVSAFDRAATIKRIANPAAKPTDLTTWPHSTTYAWTAGCANGSVILKLLLTWHIWRALNRLR